jgi:hypothetical protein
MAKHCIHPLAVYKATFELTVNAISGAVAALLKPEGIVDPDQQSDITSHLLIANGDLIARVSRVLTTGDSASAVVVTLIAERLAALQAEDPDLFDARHPYPMYAARVVWAYQHKRGDYQQIVSSMHGTVHNVLWRRRRIYALKKQMKLEGRESEIPAWSEDDAPNKAPPFNVVHG